MRTNRLSYLIFVLMFLPFSCSKKPTGTEEALFTAVREGNIQRVRSLITKGADVNVKNNVYCTPLHYAAEYGHLIVAELLIANGADVNAKTINDVTPLHMAARRGYYNVVDLLIEKGADIDTTTKKGQTPLDYATDAGYADVVGLLRGDSITNEAQEQPAPMQSSIADSNESHSVAEPLTDMQAVVNGNSVFAFDLYQKLRSSEGNLFISPYSISTALAMTCGGARGNTQKQMEKTLRFSLDQEKLHPAFAELQNGLNKLQEAGNFELHVANSLWPQHDYKFLDEYLSLTKKYYGVSITPVDYSLPAREETRKMINKWVEGKTDDKIKDLIPPGSFNDLTRLVLVNAIYFKGHWAHQFDPVKTEDTTFYVSPLESVKIPMMRQEEEFKYAEFKSLQIVELPYLGENLSMLVLLPRRIEGTEKLEERLSIDNLNFWRNSLQKTKVVVFLPKFTINSGFSLVRPLMAMGMVDAFIPGQANFAGMDGRPDWLFISGVIHQAYVDVNEQGTEAAAATATVGIGGGVAVPPTFRADRPFLFLIQESKTGSVLFMGRVTDPTKTGK
jgi:serine protease inhibitor